MPITPFACGAFTSFPTCGEWDGANHEDVLDWVRGSDKRNANIPEADRWRINTVSADMLVLHRPATHPAGYPATVTVPVGHWIALAEHDGILIVQAVNPAGFWRTSDPHGRPEQVDDVVKKPKRPSAPPR